jgi:hypothetical protein
LVCVVADRPCSRNQHGPKPVSLVIGVFVGGTIGVCDRFLQTVGVVGVGDGLCKCSVIDGLGGLPLDIVIGDKNSFDRINRIVRIDIDGKEGRRTAQQKCYDKMRRTTESSIVGWSDSGKESKEDRYGNLLFHGCPVPPHLGIDKDAPIEQPLGLRPKNAALLADERVGGLHHRYSWKKAA